MNNINKYDLLNNVISYINANEYDATINKLAQDCNTPVPYMRKLVLSLLDNQILHSCMSFDSDYEEPNEDDTLFDRYLDYSDLFREELLNGKYDDIHWYIHFNVLDYNENSLLPLSHIEYGTLKSFGENILTIKRSSMFEKKASVSPVSERVLSYKTTLLNAAINKQAVLFDYIDSSGNQKTEICHPVDIRTNLVDNWIYMYAAEGKTYRLDRIKHRCEIYKSSQVFPDYKEDPKRKYVWGSYFNKELEPIHVKLKIFKDTKNIISKIENDIRYRESTCTFIKYDDYCIYEDDVIGIEEFLRWARGYGSSIVVLEPQEKAKTIVENAHITLNNYQKSQAWGDL